MIAVVLLAAVAGAAHGACSVASWATPGVKSDRTLTSGGEEREYDVQLPPGFDGSRAYPVVFDFHGLTSTKLAQRFYSNVGNQGALSDEFIFVWAQGVGRSWAATPFCCPPATLQGIDDIAFVSDLMDSLEADLCVSSFFSTGFSNGAIMSYALGCAYPERLAAIAPIAGNLSGARCDNLPPVFAWHGDEDPTVSYSSGVDAIEEAASLNGCSSTPRSLSLTGVNGAQCQEYPNCDGTDKTQICTVPGLDHTYPPAAPAQFLEFFLDFVPGDAPIPGDDDDDVAPPATPPPSGDDDDDVAPPPTPPSSGDDDDDVGPPPTPPPSDDDDDVAPPPSDDDDDDDDVAPPPSDDDDDNNTGDTPPSPDDDTDDDDDESPAQGDSSDMDLIPIAAGAAGAGVLMIGGAVVAIRRRSRRNTGFPAYIMDERI